MTLQERFSLEEAISNVPEVQRYDSSRASRVQIAHPGEKVKHYLKSLFPIASWILHYNGKWLYGDLVAGITVGVVLVPQSMSYAQLAGLPAEYGLYSSFVGVFIYSFFATSKDVSIGPVAVMSLQVGKVIAKVQEHAGDKYAAPEIATFLSLICGGIAAGIGIIRIGFILEFISLPAVMGFMSGSAFNIMSGQVPALMGYGSAVNTRNSSCDVVIDTLKNLPKTNVNAAFGLVPLFILYTWKFSCEYAMKRWPRRKQWFFYIQQLRNAVILIVTTAISWGIIHPQLKKFDGPKSKFKGSIKTIGVVPSGLRHVGVMNIPDGIIGDMASEIPVSTIILLLEHIAISKSFGRINDYKIVPDQELIAIGVNNLIGTFFNAYPATGSFSRSALKAKCGVRTPLAGIFTGGVVLLALYCLTDAFYYIPKATLSAVIIHAVSDLISHWRATWNLWEVAPLDCGLFLIAVIITVFHLSRTGQFLGKIRVAEVINPTIKFTDSASVSSSASEVEIQQVLSNASYQSTGANKFKVGDVEKVVPTAGELVKQNPNIRFHTRWVPLNQYNTNKDVHVQPPPPGVIVFRPVEAFAYPNASDQVDRVADEAKRLTRRGNPRSFANPGDRPWNDPGPLRWRLPFWKDKFGSKLEDHREEDTRPLLRIIHFDFSCVPSIDATAIQALVDIRKALNNYADREVEFHFSGINSPWVRRGLVRAGFGSYGDTELVSEKTYVNIATQEDDLENNSYFPAVGTNTPFIHFDIPDYV
ncbi:hypothetical protein CJJ09_002956 [Candidozyma auris]|nr:hypothetical protein CJJ09_002956 [[Candida] auris]